MLEDANQAPEIDCMPLYVQINAIRKEKRMTVYEENGFTSRKEYLKSLAEDYDMDYKDVVLLATTLGATEDFDGLLTALEDYCEGWY